MPAVAFRPPSTREAANVGWLVSAISLALVLAGGTVTGTMRALIWGLSGIGLVLGIRGVRTRLVVADWGVTYRSMFESFDLPWEEIASVQKTLGFTLHKSRPRRGLGAIGEKLALVAVNGESFVCHDVIQTSDLVDGPVDLIVAEVQKGHRRFKEMTDSTLVDTVVFTGPETIVKSLATGLVAFGGVGVGIGIGRSWWAVLPGLAVVTTVVLAVRGALSRIELSPWGVRSRWMVGSTAVPWSEIRGIQKVQEAFLWGRLEKMSLITIRGDVVIHALAQFPNPLRGRVDMAVTESKRWLDTIKSSDREHDSGDDSASQ